MIYRWSRFWYDILAQTQMTFFGLSVCLFIWCREWRMYNISQETSCSAAHMHATVASDRSWSRSRPEKYQVLCGYLVVSPNHIDGCAFLCESHLLADVLSNAVYRRKEKNITEMERKVASAIWLIYLLPMVDVQSKKNDGFRRFIGFFRWLNGWIKNHEKW